MGDVRARLPRASCVTLAARSLMLNLSATVAYGAPIVIVDLVAWRLLGPGRSTAKAIGRCASFAALTYVLFATGVSPLSVPPSPDQL